MRFRFSVRRRGWVGGAYLAGDGWHHKSSHRSLRRRKPESLDGARRAAIVLVVIEVYPVVFGIRIGF
jgi:hypothetical protein